MLHETAPNEVLHFDDLFVSDSKTDFKYVLALKDNLSGGCWLEPYASVDATQAAHCIACLNRVLQPTMI